MAQASVNISIDDTFSNPSSDARLFYGLTNQLGADGNGWSIGPNCSACFLQPDPSQTFNHSWHDSSTAGSGKNGDIPYASLSFIGSAVYVMGIIIYSAPSSIDSLNNTRMFFQIDGVNEGNFTHFASVGPEVSFLYNTTFFAKENLPNGQHNITIMCGDGDLSIVSTCLLDRIIYTTNDFNANSSTGATVSSLSPANPGPSTTLTSNSVLNKSEHVSFIIIVIAVIGCTLWVTLFVGIFIIWRRRRSRKRDAMPSADISAHTVVPFEIVSSEEQARSGHDFLPDRSETMPPSYTSAVGGNGWTDSSRNIVGILPVSAQEKFAGTTRLLWPQSS